MVTRALPGNLADAMVEGVLDFGGGGAQRFAYEQGETVGMMTTAGFILGGLFLPMFVRGQMVDSLSKAAFHSGSTIAGWLATERVFKYGPRAMLPDPNRGGRRALYRMNTNGARLPEVASSGLNPNTGEVILDSRI